MGLKWRREGSASVHISASPDAVYTRIVDVTTPLEPAGESRRCEWVRGSPTQPVVGARFRGHNRVGWVRWSRLCEIVIAEPGRRFAFRTVPERFDPSRMDSTSWSYALEPEGDGTRVTHAYQIVRMPSLPFRILYGLLLPHHRDMRPSMQRTLEALKGTLEAPSGG